MWRGGAGVDLELLGTQLDRGDRTGQQVVVPVRRGRSAVVGRDHDQALAGPAEPEHRGSLLARTCAGRGEKQDGTPRHRAAHLPVVGAEFGDHLLVEGPHIGGYRRRLAGLGLVFGCFFAHALLIPEPVTISRVATFGLVTGPRHGGWS